MNNQLLGPSPDLGTGKHKRGSSSECVATFGDFAASKKLKTSTHGKTTKEQDLQTQLFGDSNLPNANANDDEHINIAVPTYAAAYQAAVHSASFSSHPESCSSSSSSLLSPSSSNIDSSFIRAMLRSDSSSSSCVAYCLSSSALSILLLSLLFGVFSAQLFLAFFFSSAVCEVPLVQWNFLCGTCGMALLAIAAARRHWETWKEDDDDESGDWSERMERYDEFCFCVSWLYRVSVAVLTIALLTYGSVLLGRVNWGSHQCPDLLFQLSRGAILTAWGVVAAVVIPCAVIVLILCFKMSD